MLQAILYILISPYVLGAAVVALIILLFVVAVIVAFIHSVGSAINNKIKEARLKHHALSKGKES